MANDYIIKIEGSWPSGETEYVIGTEDPQRLPVVSSDDNGDVLTVVDGKWSDAAPGGGGGGGLPPVTSDDNGDVLTVVDGAWDKAAPSGGGNNIVIVPYEWSDAQDKYITSASLDDTVAAYQAGKLIVFSNGFGQFLMSYCNPSAPSMRWLQFDSGVGEFIADQFYWTSSGIAHTEYYWTASTD